MSLISEKYAKALFFAVRDKGAVRETRDAFAGLVEQLKRSQVPDLSTLPVIFLSFLSVLSKRKRNRYIFEIFEKFIRLCDADAGDVRAEISTAFPLDESRRSKISGLLSRKLGSNVLLKNTTDRSVIGGAVIKIGDYVMDYSVAAGLTALKKELVK